MLLIAAGPALPLRSMQWLKVNDDRLSIVDAVNYTPDICLSAQPSPLVLEGEILFRTPRLLGGQAAKARLSCQSCHINGADNPFFHFPNASGAPGTADVSNSFFSAKGGNGSFDPVTIPDLSMPGKVSRERPGALEAFLANLIVTEFAGAQPEAAMLDALSAYMRDMQTCSAAATQRRPDLATDLALAENAMMLAQGRFADNHDAMGRMLVAGARDILGLIHERYSAKALHKERAELLKLSRKAQHFSSDMPQPERDALFSIWQNEFAKLSKGLKAQQHRSLYAQEKLKKAL